MSDFCGIPLKYSTPLQVAVYRLGVCPICHRKSLEREEFMTTAGVNFATLRCKAGCTDIWIDAYQVEPAEGAA